MPGTDLMVTHALVSATGWTLVHFLWQGCVIAFAFWLVCVLSHRESAHLRYWAGIAGLALSLAVVVLTFTVYHEPAAQFSFEPLASESVNHFLVLSGTPPDAWPMVKEGIEPILPFVVMLWIAGVLVHCVRIVCGWIGVREMIGKAIPLDDPGLLAVISGLKETLRVRQTIRVVQSIRSSMPLAVGWIKPVILLPSSVLAGLPRDQLEMILAHELVHIRRHDYLLNLLQILAETVLFYHPAIAWMSRRVREERENCCDDSVVNRCGKPATYARALANLEVLRHPMPAAVLTAGGGDLLGRIKRIVNRELPRTSSGYAQLCALAVVALAVGLGAHQGSSLSRALHQVAVAAHVQASDVEWKTWGRSREAWGAGVMDYATGLGQPEAQLVVAIPENAPVSSEVPDYETSLAPERSMVMADEDSQLRQLEFSSKQAALSGQPPPAEFAASTTTFTQIPGGGVSGTPETSAATTLPAILAVPARHEISALVPGDDHRRTLSEPDPISTVRPKYPWRARANGVEGFVELSFEVDSDGNVSEVEVLDSIPKGIFDRAASVALKKWKFLPLVDGLESRRLVQTFDFSLEEKLEPRKKRRSCVVTGRRTCSRAPSAAVVVYVNPPTKQNSVAVTN